MIRIYVAGPITPTGKTNHPGIEFISNIRRGIKGTVNVLRKGYAVFCPFIDYQYLLVLGEDEKLEASHFYESSLAYLEVSDALLVLPGWEKSKGTLAEIDRARTLGIPIFYDTETMDVHFGNKE
jgi:hypothetical protein